MKISLHILLIFMNCSIAQLAYGQNKVITPSRESIIPSKDNLSEKKDTLKMQKILKFNFGLYRYVQYSKVEYDNKTTRSKFTPAFQILTKKNNILDFDLNISISSEQMETYQDTIHRLNTQSFWSSLISSPKQNNFKIKSTNKTRDMSCFVRSSYGHNILKRSNNYILSFGPSLLTKFVRWENREYNMTYQYIATTNWFNIAADIEFVSKFGSKIGEKAYFDITIPYRFFNLKYDSRYNNSNMNLDNKSKLQFTNYLKAININMFTLQLGMGYRI